MQASPLANYLPFTPQTDAILQRLTGLQPKTLAMKPGSGPRALPATAPGWIKLTPAPGNHPAARGADRCRRRAAADAPR